MSRFPNYQPSTALRQAIAKYREVLVARKSPDGRAQREEDAARDTPGTGAPGGAARQGDEEGGAHD